jgi:hypothetical protein
LHSRGRVANASKEGGFDQTLRDTLAEYHRVRYTNYGKPLPYDEAAAAGLVEEAFVLPTGASIRNDIRVQFQVVFGDDPTDDELEHWEKFIKGRRANCIGQELRFCRGCDGGNRRVRRGVRLLPPGDLLERDEQENTELRDSLAAVSQAVAAM